MSIQNFQKHKKSGNIQSKRAGHSPIVTVHTVTVINVMLLTSKYFTFKEKIVHVEERATFPRRHTDHWLGHGKKRTLRQRSECIYLVLCTYAWRNIYIHIYMYMYIFTRGGCTHHYVHGGQRQLSALSTFDLRIKLSGQHGYQDLYSLSHLCSPINLVLKAMWSCRGGKVERGSKMFVVSSRKADRRTFRVAICKHSLTLGLPGGNQAYTEKNLPFKEKWTT